MIQFRAFRPQPVMYALVETPRTGEHIDNHSRQPKPFIWTAKASDILEKVKRAQAALV